MFDLEFHPENRPDALERLGKAMARAGVCSEMGEVFTRSAGSFS